MKKVTIATSEKCMNCLMAKQYLRKHDVVFEECSAEAVRDALEKDNVSALPAVYLDGELMCSGFNVKALQTIVDKVSN